MKILVVSNYYPPVELGGWGQLTRDVVEELIARGHEVFVLAGNYRADEVQDEKPYIKRGLYYQSPDQVNYHPVYTLLRPWWERANQNLLTKVSQAFQPDIIFINGMWNFPKSIAIQAEKLRPGRVVYYLASTWPTDVDAHTAYWLHHPANSVMKKIARPLVKGFLLPQNHQQPKLERVYCVSEFMRQYLAREAGVPLNQSRVIYNGINPDKFIPASQPEDMAHTLQILYAGVLAPHKGVHVALEAIGILVNELQETAFHLTLVGNGTPAYEQQLHHLIRESHIEPYVTFKGRVARHEMPNILQQFQVLLFPSTGPEALARMTQEAMASGLLVIGSTSGGTPELVQDGQNGLTYRADDPQTLAKKIVWAIHHPKKRAEMAHAARQTVLEKFTFNRMVDELEENFADVLAQSVSPQSTGVKA